tara:strand:- start:165 stop:890 length:726 start_codon:yes stop_codon:yes gene_type:complete
MININKFKELVYTVANKNGRGTLTPEQFNSLAKSALYTYTNNQLSNWRQYNPGQPTPQTSLDLDSLSQSKLRHLKETRSIRVIDGEANLPNGVNTDVNSLVMPDMWMPSKISHKYSSNGNLIQKGVKLVKDMEWDDIISSDIIFPTKKRAVANMKSNSLQVEPKALLNLVNLTYIRNPTDPEWKYSVENGRPVYDDINSIDLDAPESAMNEIAMIALELIASKIRDGELLQASTSMENKGV